MLYNVSFYNVNLIKMYDLIRRYFIRRVHKPLLLVVVMFSLIIPSIINAQTFPERLVPSRFVNDYTDTLKFEEKDALERRLVELDNTTSTQITIVIIQDLNGYSIEDYTYNLIEKWGISQKENNNFGMLLVALEDRKVRIDIGLGLEVAISDTFAGHILEDDIIPYFKEGRYYEGLDRATDSLYARILHTSHVIADCEKADTLVKEANGLIAKEPAKAETLYHDAVKLCPDSASVHYNLGLAKFNRGDFSSAAISFKEALRLNPNNIEAMNGLALSYASQGINYDESKTLIENALKIRPNDSLLKESVRFIEASRKPPYIIADLVIEDSDGNNILDAGEDVVFRFSVENKGKGTAISLVAKSDAPEFLKDLKSVSIGRVMPSEKIEKVVNLRIPYSVKTGEYKLGVTVVEESGRYGAAPMEYTIPVKSPVPPRFVVNAQIDDDMAGDSSGNGNGVIEKGETIEIHLSVSNEGSGAAKNVIARIKPAVEGIGLFVSEARLGNIPYQRSIDGTLVFSVPMTFKGDRLPVEIVIEEETGLFTAKHLQNFAVAEAGGKKMKMGAVLTPDEKAASPARFSFAAASVENIAEAVHRLNISEAKEHKDYYAVVIGIERYRDIKSDAMYAVKDAEWVREYLIKGVGIPKANIRTLINENATKGDIEKTVEVWLRNKVKGSNSMVFFYYSGHGAPDVKGDTEAYIVPYDGDPDYLEKTAYPLKSLYASLSQLPSENVIAVLDSCFAGRGDRSVLASGVKPIVLEVKNPYTAMGNTVILAAAEPKEVSSAYSDAGHGLFTYYLLRGLNGEADTNKDGWVELNELFTYTDSKVIETAGEMNREQHPVMSPRMEDLGERGKMRLTRVK